MGYSEEKKINFDLGLIRNHYVGRTFIEPAQKMRDLGVKLKLNPNKSTIQNKKIILVDDSLVRGTTSHKLLKCYMIQVQKKFILKLHLQK